MSEPVFTFRLATPDDAEVLQAIYAPYVETTVTFEYVAPTVEEFRQRIIDRVSVYPYIVCEEDGVPLATPTRAACTSRAAYAWAVELSVYFAPNHRGRGMGRKIYDKMLSLLKLQGVRTVHGKVTFPNPASDKLHNAMGFKLRPRLRTSASRMANGAPSTIGKSRLVTSRARRSPLPPSPSSIRQRCKRF